MKNLFLEKIENKSLKVGVIGLGYVGLPLLLRFSESKIQSIGFDIDSNKIDQLNKQQSYLETVKADRLESAAQYFEGTSDFSRIDEVDAIIICVPTPLTKNKDPDLSYIQKTVQAILPHLRKGQLISLESTTYPGTTEEEIVKVVGRQGFEIGEDIFVTFSPEREDPGNKNFSTRTIPKVIGGKTGNCLEVGKSLYSVGIDQVVEVSSLEAAEMTKLLENIHRAVNIGLVNELKVVSDKMGLDINEIVDAAATKPFGFVPYRPGPGLGGHCIPIDPFYLTWKAKELGLNTRFIELAGEINSSMPDYVVSKISEGLNERGLPIKGSKFLILGMAYKKNVNDLRESPSLEIYSILSKKGGVVSYSDEFVPSLPKLRAYDLEGVESVDYKSKISDFDCVIISTDHDYYDYDFLASNAKLLVDTRGRLRGDRENLIKA